MKSEDLDKGFTLTESSLFLYDTMEYVCKGEVMYVT